MMAWERIIPIREPDPNEVEPLSMEGLTANSAYWRIQSIAPSDKFLSQRMDKVRKIVESPIEAFMMCCLACLLSDGLVPLRIVKGRSLRAIRGRPGNTLAAQVPVGRFRVDIVLSRTNDDGKSFAIAIECDGAAFHQATDEQRARDASRDEWLAGHFNGVIRFKGSEIHKDPVRCAEKACRMLVERMDRDMAAQARRNATGSPAPVAGE